MSDRYGPWEAPCPYCGATTTCDTVDVGIGHVQCGPFWCQECGASQIGPHDEERPLTDREKETRWYEPGSPCGSSANSIDGIPVSAELAQAVYEFERMFDVQLLDSTKRRADRGEDE